MKSPYVMMGGTFDPIHHGHLRTALEIQQWLNVPKVNLVPAKVPVHRESPGSSAEHRLAMVQHAVADEPALGCNALEIESSHDSYTVLTLEKLRKEHGEDTPLIMIVGMDAFLKLHTWFRASELLTLANILVVARPGYQAHFCDALKALVDSHITADKALLLARPQGVVCFHELTPLAISATQIRNLIDDGLSARYLLPESVRRYIDDNQLYRTT